MAYWFGEVGILKGMTGTHDGNDTMVTGIVTPESVWSAVMTGTTGFHPNVLTIVLSTSKEVEKKGVFSCHFRHSVMAYR
jgi:hypothetical protein